MAVYTTLTLIEVSNKKFNALEEAVKKLQREYNSTVLGDDAEAIENTYSKIEGFKEAIRCFGYDLDIKSQPKL